MPRTDTNKADGLKKQKTNTAMTSQNLFTADDNAKRSPGIDAGVLTVHNQVQMRRYFAP
jgi:hypothetical protein